MSKKLASLQQALNTAAGSPTLKPDKASAPTISKESADQGKKATTRHKKENVSVWLHPDFKKSLRLAQIRQPDKVYLDDLVAEALNDLFRKYDVPTVTHN
jgi:hypothetical protein